MANQPDTRHQAGVRMCNGSWVAISLTIAIATESLVTISMIKSAYGNSPRFDTLAEADIIGFGLSELERLTGLFSISGNIDGTLARESSVISNSPLIDPCLTRGEYHVMLRARWEWK